MWLLWIGCSEEDGPPRVRLGRDRVDDNVLAVVIHLRRRVVDDAVLRCVGPGIPDEVHEIELGPVRDDEEVFLPGLLADTTYRCEVVGQPSEVLEFKTDRLPRDLPSTTLVEAGAGGGDYLVLNHCTEYPDDRNTKILIYDERGRLRHYVFLDPTSPDLDVHYLGDGEILYAGGYKAVPTVIDLTGQVVLQAPGPMGVGGKYNHTVERLASGEFLTVESEVNQAPDDPSYAWSGFVIQRLSPSLQSRVWGLFSQELVNDGSLPVPAVSGSDPYHINALQWLEDDGQVLASLYRRNTLFWLDTDSGTVVEQLGWQSGWTLVDAAGARLPDAEWFFGQHAPELDGTRLLLHDNGVARPDGRRQTRVVEYELDFATHTATLVWQWTQPVWFETILGDVDRLPDGRVGITHAHCEKCTDVAGQHTEVLVVDRATGGVDWRLRFSDPHEMGYRSEWIDGCDLFHRRSTCTR